jgi:hypothetical protein
MLEEHNFFMTCLQQFQFTMFLFLDSVLGVKMFNIFGQYTEIFWEKGLFCCTFD